MSTQQILGVVGGVVGAFFGYPQLGFVVGSLVGGLLTPGEKTEGPRVDDLKVQVSTYGAGIPILYGTERVGGNVVWSTDKIEMEETTGGKGGAPEQTTYRYFVHMGIVLCETPRDGSEVSIAQIFQDGKLIYDAHSGIPVGSALASAENPHAYFVLHQGHADQLPDPGEEAWMGGPGSVPAYRGVVRIRMNAVECPGGRVPQFSFVISTSFALVVEKAQLYQVPAIAGEAHAFALVGLTQTLHVSESDGEPGTGIRTLTRVVASGDGSKQMTALRMPYGADICVPIVGTAFGDPDNPAAAARSAFSPWGAPNYFSTSVLKWVERVDLETGQVTKLFDFAASNSSEAIGFAGNDYCIASHHDVYALSSLKPVVENVYAERPAFILDGIVSQVVDAIPGGLTGPLAIRDGVMYVLNKRGSQLFLRKYEIEAGTLLEEVPGPVVTMPADSYFYNAGVRVDERGAYVWIPLGATTAHVYSIAPEGWTLLCNDAMTAPQKEQQSSNTTFYADSGLCVIGPSAAESGARNYDLIRFNAVTISSVKAKDIIAEQCERAGESRFDVSGIPDADVVHGYKLQNPANARANIDPLLTAFAAYIVDEDGVIKFKKYEDIVSVATIAYDELGQAEAGADPADAMPLNRAQEIDLPRSVSVSYLEPLRDYQTASEKEVRQITDANEDMIVELPLATTSDHAKRVAQTILFNRWRAQNTRSCKVSRKYAFASSGDGITVEYPRSTWRLWRITSMTDTGALCEFNVEPGDAELYTQTAVGATGYVPQEVAPLPAQTQLQLLDIPILRDEDSNAGIYAAMAGFSTPWSGASLYVGDDATNLESRGAVSRGAVIGACETVLGTWAPGMVDEKSLLTVNVGNSSLSTISYDSLLTGSENVAAVGAPGRWEIVKFRSVSSLGAGRFTLSGFLRGQRGTEWAIGSHAAGDAFVILADAGILRVALDSGNIGQQKTYKAVTKGRPFSSGISQAYVNSAEALETFSPTNLLKTLQVGGDLLFGWVRRTRLSENWLRGVVPLGEAAEAYEFVIFTDSTFGAVRRVISTNTRSATYTSAMQTADGYVGGFLYVRVYQLSDVVGRGHALEATI